LNFGRDRIEILPKHPSESIRILGVWYNANNTKNFAVGQAKEEVWELVNLIAKKHITDKHMLYMFNRLIVPKIKYRTQITVLNEEQCRKIMSPFFRTFKNKLRLARTAPNAILNNSYIYGVQNLSEIQKQSKITNWLIQLNNKGKLGRITTIRLRGLQ